MRFAIVKCHGSGNDFPMIDARALSLSEAEWAGVARALADRAGPVGGDGLLLLVPGDHHAEFGMVMRNSDGSEAETSSPAAAPPQRPVRAAGWADRPG